MTIDSAFGFEQPEDSPGFLLWQTTVTWQRLIKARLDPHNVTHAQFVIMALLLWFEENQHPPTQVALVNQSKLDKMTVSSSLKKLVSQGYVHRLPSETDSRAKWVRLTPKGKNFTQKLVLLVEGVDADFFGRLNRSDERDIVRILRNLMTEKHHDKT